MNIDFSNFKRDPDAPIRSIAEVQAIVAANNEKLAALEPQIVAALQAVKDDVDNMTPDEIAAYFETLERDRRAMGGIDYFKDPDALRALLDKLDGKVELPNTIVQVTVRDIVMQNFFKEWCCQCPIMQLYTLPAGEGDVEDTAGALCPEELLDTCPQLLLLRDISRIKPPEDWLPDDTFQTYTERRSQQCQTPKQAP